MNMVTNDYVGWHIAVLIPARNEELLLPRCLKSVLTARAVLPAGVTSDVVVVSDNSTDRTIELAQMMLCSNGAVLQADAGRVGIARAMAARAAMERHQGVLSRCWFANTDADCEVPSTWLLDHLQIACKGYAAVAGIVDVHDFSEHLPIVEESFRRSYRIEADGTHPHVHGANLGVRADAYVMAGGRGALATAEDHDLWGRLHALGGFHLSDARLQVITSGRRVGRAPAGFAEALAAQNLMVAA